MGKLSVFSSADVIYLYSGWEVLYMSLGVQVI